MQIPISIVIPFRFEEKGSLHFWFQTRREDGPLDGLLEWPGGKIEVGESPLDAAAREFKEEVGMELPKGSFIPFQNYSFDYEDRSLTLFCHLLLISEKKLSQGWHKFNINNPLELEKRVPEANIRILEDLGAYFKKIIETNQWRDLWEIS